MNEITRKSLDVLNRIDALATHQKYLGARLADAVDYPNELDRQESLILLYREDLDFRTMESGPKGMAPDPLAPDLSFDYSKKDRMSLERFLGQYFDFRISQLEAKSDFFFQKLSGRDAGATHAKLLRQEFLQVLRETTYEGLNADVLQGPVRISEDLKDASMLAKLYRKHILDDRSVNVGEQRNMFTMLQDIREGSRWLSVVSTHGFPDARMIFHNPALHDFAPPVSTKPRLVENKESITGNDELEAFAKMREQVDKPRSGNVIDIFSIKSKRDQGRPI